MGAAAPAPLRAPPVLPFTALVGQDDLQRALTMLAANPRLRGVLIRGERGTAKSTAARALARLLPPARLHADCPFGCLADSPRAWCDACRAASDHRVITRRPPFETLPLGITEDQLVGTLDLERALRHGEQRLAPGLLARVNQGVLYVDEVNLLDDPLVDLLLDVAASGVNVVAREGVTAAHPAAFLLVGTMNPEEGELRPQLVDRFGLSVHIRGLDDPEARADVTARALDFEADPDAFRAAYRPQEEALAARIVAARELLAGARPARPLLLDAARVALALGVDGHRADQLMVKGAMTLAALDGRAAASRDDLAVAAALVLPHRLRSDPFEGEPLTPAEVEAEARAVLASASAGKKKPAA